MGHPPILFRVVSHNFGVTLFFMGSFFRIGPGRAKDAAHLVRLSALGSRAWLGALEDPELPALEPELRTPAAAGAGAGEGGGCNPWRDQIGFPQGPNVYLKGCL